MTILATDLSPHSNFSAKLDSTILCHPDPYINHLRLWLIRHVQELPHATGKEAYVGI